MQTSLLKKSVAEFIGTFALIFVGIGAIHHLGGVPGGLLGIALAHGLTIAVMVSATGGISGGHLNPAVTFGLLLGGKMKVARWYGPALAVGNWKDAAVYIAGPQLGGGPAGIICGRFLIQP